jgi:ABC-type glutathione transport system ATPase component
VSSSSAIHPLLVVDGLQKTFDRRGAWLTGRGGGTNAAVDGVSFAIERGRTLGLIGESGSGKSTTARCILRLIEPSAGTILLDGHNVSTAAPRELRRLRRHMQIVFQSPYGSLDPRRSVGSSIAEPLVAHGIGTRTTRSARVRELLEHVGLNPNAGRRRPQEFSGGERQRIAIARALALEPSLVVCDEPVSALDVSVQAQILNLLRDLQDEFGLTYLFISHDIGVVRTMSDQIVVMKDGVIVEAGPADRVCSRPEHPYTQSLIAAAATEAPIATTKES